LALAASSKKDEWVKMVKHAFRCFEACAANQHDGAVPSLERHAMVPFVAGGLQ